MDGQAASSVEPKTIAKPWRQNRRHRPVEREGSHKIASLIASTKKVKGREPPLEHWHGFHSALQIPPLGILVRAPSAGARQGAFGSARLLVWRRGRKTKGPTPEWCRALGSGWSSGQCYGSRVSDAGLVTAVGAPCKLIARAAWSKVKPTNEGRLPAGTVMRARAWPLASRKPNDLEYGAPFG